MDLGVSGKWGWNKCGAMLYMDNIFVKKEGCNTVHIISIYNTYMIL